MIEIDPGSGARLLGWFTIRSITPWDQKRLLLKISNEEAARHFTDILLRGVLARKPAGKRDGIANGRRVANGSRAASGTKK
jgi:hypothetical protein